MMLTIFIFTVWLTGFLVSFRYFGHHLAAPSLDRDCAWPSICSPCKCVNCGGTRSAHKNDYDWETKCRDYFPKHGHASDWLFSIVISGLWPITVPIVAIEEHVPKPKLPKFNYFRPVPKALKGKSK